MLHNLVYVLETVSFLVIFEKLWKASYWLSFCPSVRLRGENRLQLGGFFVKSYSRGFFKDLSRKFKFY